MNAGVLSNSAVTAVLAFAFSLVGCLLALHSFARAINASGSLGRFGWLFLGAWALAATAVWDLFLVVAIDLQTEGLQVRYDIISIIASIAVSVLASAAILWLVLRSANTVGLLLGGLLVGGVMGLDCFRVLTAIRVNAVVTFRTPMIVVVVLLLATTTAPALLFSVRSTRHGVLTGTAAFLAAMMTVAHYLGLYAIDISQPVASSVTTGLVPAAVILPVAITFVLRLLLLLLVLLANSTAATASRDAPVVV
jgi:NO-binding membrane sensor protein with MHYT domain